MTQAEIKHEDGWQSLSIENAMRELSPRLRCAECHGAVYLMRDYTAVRSSVFVHRRSFAGCGGSADGVPRRHPEALA